MGQKRNVEQNKKKTKYVPRTSFEPFIARHLPAIRPGSHESSSVEPSFALAELNTTKSCALISLQMQTNNREITLKGHHDHVPSVHTTRTDSHALSCLEDKMFYLEDHAYCSIVKDSTIPSLLKTNTELIGDRQTCAGISNNHEYYSVVDEIVMPPVKTSRVSTCIKGAQIDYPVLKKK